VADTKLICGPWADLTDLPTPRPDIPDAQFEALLWMASELLWALSGRQFSGGCESTVTLRENPAGGWCWADIAWPLWDTTGYGWWPLRSWRGGLGRRVVALPDPPVTAVSAVEIGGVPLGADEYTVEYPGGLVTRIGGAAWPTDGSLAITYAHGINPPIGGRQSAVTLAVELAKAMTSDPGCKLPQRLQTITREGVTVGFQDSFASLDKARTGIWSIDAWLLSVNPAGISRRARVWTPELARARRTLP
jgi:hypothetical protein